LIPPPSKVGNAARPGFAVEQGAGLTIPELDTVVFWELMAGLPKSAPSGDVDPILPEVGMLVCATLWPAPSAVMASITTAARGNFIVFPLLARCAAA
jgi:hypothetical protein